MKTDSAIRVFSEKYDRTAIQSIDDISKDIGLVANGHTIKAFNLSESFKIFEEFLRGYGNYKVEHIGDDKASSQDVIRDNFSKFTDTSIFKEASVKYGDLPAFVRSYVEGVESLSETANEVKGQMIDAGVATEAVGDVNDFVDHFMDRLQESFDPTMEKILWASGYNAHQRMNKKRVEPKPVFL